MQRTERKIDPSRYPKGTFFVISKVGEDPLKRHLKQKRMEKLKWWKRVAIVLLALGLLYLASFLQ
jgi:hypothetical protein